MPCSPLSLVSVVVASVVLPSVALAAGPNDDAPAFLHVQADRPSYRLGETVWFRVHVRNARRPITVRLIGPGDEVVSEAVYREETPAKSARPTRKIEPTIAGQFLLPIGNPGGAHRLEARAADGTAHSLDLDVHEIALPRADLRLTLIGDVFFPGARVTATFQALDLKGRPIRGARVEHRATFGGAAIRESRGVTDADGRAEPLEIRVLHPVGTEALAPPPRWLVR